MIHPTADDLEEYKREDREDRAQALREQQRMREPPIGDPCGKCDGSGILEVRQGSYPNGVYFLDSVCPRCQGTGVW